MTGAGRRHLRGLAHHLKPVVHIGKNGIEENVVKTVGAALDAHELIKIQFVHGKETRRDLSNQIAELSKSELVGLIGNIAILYRQNADEKKTQDPPSVGAKGRTAWVELEPLTPDRYVVATVKSLKFGVRQVSPLSGARHAVLRKKRSRACSRCFLCLPFICRVTSLVAEGGWSPLGV